MLILNGYFYFQAMGVFTQLSCFLFFFQNQQVIFPKARSFVSGSTPKTHKPKSTHALDYPCQRPAKHSNLAKSEDFSMFVAMLEIRSPSSPELVDIELEKK